METNDWDCVVDDAEISEQNGQKTDFTVLPPGNYKYTIAKVEHSTYQPKDGKTTGITATCKQIKLGVIIDGGSLGKSWADDNLYAWPSCMFRVLMVLKSIGEIKDGFKGSVGDHLDALKGGEGVCKIDVEKYHSNKTGNDEQKNVIKIYHKPTDKVELTAGQSGEDF